MSRILLTGSTGQVGWELARALMPLGTVLIPDREQFDLTKPQTLAASIANLRPDVIVNCAAYTAVDKAEQEEHVAKAVNADSPAELATAARSAGALLVHYSTDYIFDGEKKDPYTEQDTPNPRSAYGRSKLAGEEAIRASGADFVILRTSWVYAARGKNFLKTVLRLAAEREELRIVGDQIGAPTWARLIAETTGLMLRQELERKKTASFKSGTLNLTAAGETSWHGFATAIISGARERGANIKCRTVVPITTAEYPLPARRPANSRLAGGELERRYGLKMPTWQLCTALCLDEIIGSSSV